MCVVFIERYLDGPDQSQSQLYKNTHRTQRRTHQRSPRLQALMIMLPDGEKEESKMCVVFIGRQEDLYRTQRCNNQRSPRVQASIIMLPDGEKEVSTMCVVLIVSQQDGPWRRKYAQYLDGPEQSKRWLCKHTCHTQCRTHQCSPCLQASIIMFPDGEKAVSTMCVIFIGRQQEGPCHQKHLYRSTQPQRLW